MMIKTSRSPADLRSPEHGTDRADFPLWGGEASVAVTNPADLGSALTVVREKLARIDAACSNYRDNSELVRLNRSRGQATKVSATLAQAIKAAIRAARKSEGLVDPTATALGAKITGPGWRHVLLDENTSTVIVGEGLTLDLGATAKAWAADQCAAAVVDRCGGGALVCLLGDVSAFGTSPDGGWIVTVTENHRASANQDTDTSVNTQISLVSGGLATSGTTTRKLDRRSPRPGVAPRSVVVQGAKVKSKSNHIVDPLTRRPVRGSWRTATVAANTCLAANTGSTAAIVLGSRSSPWGVVTEHPTDAIEWLSDRNFPARLVAQDGKVTTVGRWPS